MKQNNSKIGSSFESEFCDYLSSKGYWVHFIERKRNGMQPFDIIACKNGNVVAIDTKTSSNGVFDLDRIEYNQEMAFEKFFECKNYSSYFVVKHKEIYYYIPAIFAIKQKRNGVSSIKLGEEYANTSL